MLSTLSLSACYCSSGSLFLFPFLSSPNSLCLSAVFRSLSHPRSLAPSTYPLAHGSERESSPFLGAPSSSREPRPRAFATALLLSIRLWKRVFLRIFRGFPRPRSALLVWNNENSKKPDCPSFSRFVFFHVTFFLSLIIPRGLIRCPRATAIPFVAILPSEC